MRRLALLLVVACKPKEVEPRAIDAGRPADAAIDAPPIDAAPAKAAAKPVKLAAGDATCAVLDDHTVECWGVNDHGQLGNGTRTDSAVPVPLELHAVKDVAIAGGTACALLDDGSVTCWGRIAWHGKVENTLKPAGVLGVVGVTQLFVQPGRACGRVANDQLVCWGDVDPAGHPRDVGAARQPTPAVGFAHVVALTAIAALRDDGTVFTWSGKSPTLAGAVELGVRDLAVCGRLEDGSVQCPVPRCGPPPVAEPVAPPPKKPGKKPAKKPAKVVKPPPQLETLALPPAKQLAFELGWCVVTKDDKLACSDGCALPAKVALDHVDRVAGHCVVQTTGAVRCDGKLISGVAKPTALAGNCAIVGEQILCWGAEGKAAPVPR